MLNLQTCSDEKKDKLIKNENSKCKVILIVPNLKTQRENVAFNACLQKSVTLLSHFKLT